MQLSDRVNVAFAMLRSSALRSRQHDLESVMTPSQRPAGFSLIELVIVLLIVGILAVVASSRVMNIRDDARINAVATEANRLNRLAMVASAQLGRLPNDVNQGVVPIELRPPLFTNSFSSATPAGGLWDWNGPGTTVPYLGMSVNYASASDEPSGLYAQLDTKFDDGNAGTGKIRRHVLGSRPVWCFLIQ